MNRMIPPELGEEVRSVKVCLNALFFNPGQMGGTETYFRELVCHLPLVSDDDFFTVLTTSNYRNEFTAFEGISVAAIKSYEQPTLRRLLHRTIRSIMNFDPYARGLANQQSDVIHYPFTIIDPLVLDRPIILTFWDMQHEFYPEFFSRKELRFRAKTFKRSARLATRIIVSAQFTKKCLIEKYSINPSKIDVVYTGFSPIFHVLENDDAPDRVRTLYGIDRPFMFYPAATWPHKNHAILLDAMKLLTDRWKYDGMLVLSGIAMKSQLDVARKIQSLGLTHRVKVLGHVPFSDLPYLYNKARLLVFPSLFEGFGIPLVEAMACGCPVVASDNTTIPEVLGDAGRFFVPTSAEDIAASIWSVWNDDNALSTMRSKGLKRASMFCWEETARNTLSVYHKAIH
jgi:glycosyltransferase involved in cell wall biosynthesis